MKVRDFKMKFESGQWQDQSETTFNEKKLAQLALRLQDMSDDVQHVVQRLPQS